MASLVIAEHDNKSLKDSTAKTVTAAAQVSAPVHVLVAGSNCAAVAEAGAAQAYPLPGSRARKDSRARNNSPRKRPVLGV